MLIPVFKYQIYIRAKQERASKNKTQNKNEKKKKITDKLVKNRSYVFPNGCAHHELLPNHIPCMNEREEERNTVNEKDEEEKK